MPKWVSTCLIVLNSQSYLAHLPAMTPGQSALDNFARRSSSSQSTNQRLAASVFAVSACLPRGFAYLREMRNLPTFRNSLFALLGLLSAGCASTVRYVNYSEHLAAYDVDDQRDRENEDSSAVGVVGHSTFCRKRRTELLANWLPQAKVNGLPAQLRPSPDVGGCRDEQGSD